MGSPYCERLIGFEGLQYAFSCDLFPQGNGKRLGCTIHLAEGPHATHSQNKFFVSEVVFDTGANSSAISVVYIAELLRKVTGKADTSLDDAWKWLAAQGLPSVRCNSLLAEPIMECLTGDAAQAAKAATIGFKIPLLLAFPACNREAIKVEATVVKTKSRKMLLSPKDVAPSFLVLLDSAKVNSHVPNATTRLRFFRHTQSELRSIESWLVASKFSFHLPRAGSKSKSQQPVP